MDFSWSAEQNDLFDAIEAFASGELNRDLIQHDRPEWFDFGGGDADYKELFATHASRSGTVWLFPPTVANQLIVPYLRGCHALRHVARKWIGDAGLTSKFRQWVRYGSRLQNVDEINHKDTKDTEEEKK